MITNEDRRLMKQEIKESEALISFFNALKYLIYSCMAMFILAFIKAFF